MDHIHVDLSPEAVKEGVRDLTRVFAAWHDTGHSLFEREMNAIVQKLLRITDPTEQAAAIAAELYGFALVAASLRSIVRREAFEGAEGPEALEAIDSLDDVDFMRAIEDGIVELIDHKDPPQ